MNIKDKELARYPGLRKDAIRLHENDYLPVYMVVTRCHKTGNIKLFFEFRGYAGYVSIQQSLSWFVANFQPTAGISGGPGFWGSARCESNSLASGGTRSHCSCDTCF